MSVELKERSKQFALRVITLVDALPNSAAGRTLGNQLIRSGTSVGANYRAASRARSKAEFIAKIGTVVEESDESASWLELIIEGKLIRPAKVQPLLEEANELTAIFNASRITAVKNKEREDKEQKQKKRKPPEENDKGRS
jgi:four helix bundle protein